MPHVQKHHFILHWLCLVFRQQAWNLSWEIKMTWHDSKQKEMISYHDDIHWRFRCLMCRHRLKMHHIIHFGILPQMVQGSWSKSSTCFTAVRHTSQWLVSSDTDTWSLFEASSTIPFFYDVNDIEFHLSHIISVLSSMRHDSVQYHQFSGRANWNQLKWRHYIVIKKV